MRLKKHRELGTQDTSDQPTLSFLRIRGGKDPENSAQTAQADQPTLPPTTIIASLRSLDPMLADGNNYHVCISLYEGALLALGLWDKTSDLPRENDAL
jgi:hypothetical protein